LEVLDAETIEKELLPDLLTFQNDPVSNVRLMLARIIKERLETFKGLSNESRERILEVEKRLKDDPSDIEVVRFFRTETEVKEWQQNLKNKKETQGAEKETPVAPEEQEEEVEAEAKPAEAMEVETAEDTTAASVAQES